MTVRVPAPPQSILITGASSGIGEALALAYAVPGVRLALSGRHRSRLDAVVEKCRHQGAIAEGRTINVTDCDAMQGWIQSVEHAGPLDLVIANAGISAGTSGGGEAERQVRLIFDTNLTGTLNTVLPAIEAMRTRRRGQIAVMSSAAGFRGFPGAPSYSASKAAVRIYGEALRGMLDQDGISVSVICPGFVRSRITAANRFRMPFLMDADRAAAIIRRGLAKNKSRIAFPWPTYFASWLTGALPPGLTDVFFRKLPEK